MTPVPFYVPSEYASAARGTAFSVTTTADEDDSTCDQAGTGLSLREALTACATLADHYTVYVPSGVYALDSVVAPAFSGLALIGEDPFNTVIRAAEVPRAGADNLIDLAIAGTTVTIMNLTFHNGAAAAGNGGAIHIGGGGAVSIANTRFVGNHAANGGALYIDSNDHPVAATLSYTSFFGNTANIDGGAIYFLGDGSNGSHLWIQNSTFDSNQAGLTNCSAGGGAVTAVFSAGAGDAVTIDSAGFYDNTIVNGGCPGGALMTTHSQGALSLNVSYSFFEDNSAPGGQGGAIYAASQSGSHNIASSYFVSNAAGDGGAIYDDFSSGFNVDGGGFFDNIATGDGGALYLSSGFSATLTYTSLVGNRAANAGGAAYLRVQPAYIGNATIISNRAGDPDGLGGQGGGIYADSFGATLQNTRVEDNLAQFGPDCLTFAASPPADPVVSLGGVGISDTDSCVYVAHKTDQFNNLLDNGGFEQAGANEAIPAGWTLRDARGDTRNCLGFTPFGFCAFVFKGSANEKSVLIQHVDPGSLSFERGDVLRLFAVGEGGGASKVKLVATVRYTDPSRPPGKARISFDGPTRSYFEARSADLTLADSSISAIKVKIVNRSAHGKFYLDRVYLFVPADTSGPRGPRTALPVPAVPSGFRGR